MTFYTYEEMLKRAIEKIPENILKKERFQVPPVILEVQKTKSLFKNFGEIASVLRREPNHLAKFIFKELATSGSMDGDELLLQGRASKESLQRKIDEYIKNFVYCKECGRPDTKLVKEGRLMFLKCEACGAKQPVGNL